MKFKKVIDKKLYWYEHTPVSNIKVRGVLEYKGMQFLLDFGDFNDCIPEDDEKFKKVKELVELLEERINNQ